MFGKFGSIKSLKVVEAKSKAENQKMRYYAFVAYSTEEEAKKAKTELHEKILEKKV